MADEKTSTPSAGGAEPKKSNAAVIIIVVILVILLLGFGSCAMFGCWATSKVKNITNDGFSVNTPEGEVNVNTSETGNVSWPKDITSDVPQFSAGKIEGTTKVDKIWTIIAKDVSDTDIQSYKNSLVAKGWTIEGEVDAGVVKTYSATKGNYQVSVSYSPGESSVIIGVNTDVSATQN